VPSPDRLDVLVYAIAARKPDWQGART